MAFLAGSKGQNITRFPKTREKTGGIGNKMKNQDHADHTIKNVKDIEKIIEDLRRIAVTQIPVKDHQLKQVGKMRND